jgi:sugar lactone lactonase YvrE
MIQGGAIMPDALRWLWRDYPQPIAKPPMRAQGDPKTGFPGVDSDWELVSFGGRVPSKTTLELLTGGPPPKLRDTIGMTVDQQGDVFTSDASGKAIYRIGAEGQVSTFVRDANGVRGLAMGSDGLLYACDGTGITSYASDGKRSAQLPGVNCKGIAADRRGGFYFSEYPFGVVSYLPHGSSKMWNRYGALPSGSLDGSKPNGICMSPDQALVYVSDPWTKWVWSYSVQADGSLADGEPFFRMETLDETLASGASGVVMDHGLLYIATLLGIQICDQQGRVVAILNRPENAQSWTGPIAGVAIGGPDHQYLYAVVGNKVFRRHLVRRGGS